jgi:hypothetical protein
MDLLFLPTTQINPVVHIKNIHALSSLVLFAKNINNPAKVPNRIIEVDFNLKLCSFKRNFVLINNANEIKTRIS